MEISEITIRNFKGIEEVTMGPIKPINVLIGRNNSGKSSVLTCIQLLNKFFMPKSFPATETIAIQDEYFRKDAGQDAKFEIVIIVKQNKEELESQFKTTPIDEKRLKNYLDKELFARLIFEFQGSIKNKMFGLTSIKTKEGEGIASKNVTIADSASPGTPLQCLPLVYLFKQESRFNNLEELASQKKAKLTISNNGLIAQSEQPLEFPDVKQLNPAFEHIKKIFQTAFMVSPYRRGEKSEHMQQHIQTLDENGANIVSHLHKMSLNRNKIFREIDDFVRRIAPDVGRLHPRFVDPSNPNSKLELAYEWPDDRVVNLENMGGGIEQLVILGCILLERKIACVLLEEPESHLHPGAQDILLSEFEKYVGDSTIFVTTHSPVFVRSNDKIAVHIITNKDGKSGTGRTLSSTELQMAAMVLGSRPGHLAQADIVVYVEGKWGAAAFEKWLEKWPDRGKVLGHLLLVVHFFSPDDIGTKDFDLAPLRKVTQNMIMFVDKDNDEGSSEPKPTRQELQEKCKALGIPCIITEKRQIEDYFTEDAVRQVLPSNILAGWKYEAGKPMNEQLPTKKYNAKIAAAMKWEDVAEHKDIMKVFEEIEKFAKNLKPETNG
jgi:predicted ATPase